MGCRNLTDAASPPRRGESDSTVTRTHRVTGEALLAPDEESAERGGPAVCNVSLNREGKDEMTKASIRLQDLRRRLYVKAKAETSWRFWGLYVHVCKMETLRQAYAMAKENDGAPGVDGITFEAIEAQGVEAFLEQI